MILCDILNLHIALGEDIMDAIFGMFIAIK
jgi:hypothetical protein